MFEPSQNPSNKSSSPIVDTFSKHRHPGDVQTRIDCGVKSCHDNVSDQHSIPVDTRPVQDCLVHVEPEDNVIQHVEAEYGQVTD